MSRGALITGALAIVLVVAAVVLAVLNSGGAGSSASTGTAIATVTTPEATTPAPEATAPAPATAARTTPPPPPRARPVVWVQAGHAEPREAGYRAQTGAGGGPFGGEIGFTTRLAPAIVQRLRQAGVDARETPGEVTPNMAPGAAFVAVHHDAPGGQAVVGAASTGGGENYYHGEGTPPPSPTPYPDSAPHRPATTVSPQVASRSAGLARAVANRFGRVYTPANGANGSFAGAVTDASNTRVANYYAFYRSGADARIIIEAGGAGTDDAFLRRVDLIADAVADGVLDHLRDRGLLG